MNADVRTIDAAGIEHFYCSHHAPVKKPVIIDMSKPRARDYIFFALIIIGICAVSFVIARYGFGGGMSMWMRSFMGVFFVVFAFFKLLDIRGFAASYAAYDLIAKKFFVYGYVYPCIELMLGIGFLTGLFLLAAEWITLFLMIIGSIAIVRELLKKNEIRCACLGTYIKLPLSTVSLTEDLVMGGLALIALAARFIHF